MKLKYSLKLKSVYFIVICFAFFSQSALLDHTLRGNFESRDWRSIEEERYFELKKNLPAHYTVGYVCDGVNKNIPVSEEYNLFAQYLLAQWVLSPVILHRSLNEKVIIGNFNSPDSKFLFSEKLNFSIIRDFGGGVVLFRRDNY